MRLGHYVVIAAFGVVGPINPIVSAYEDPVELKDLPELVRQAADQAVPQAKWAKATKETEDGDTTYELKGSDAKGREVTITLSSAGRVQVITTVLTVTDLPKLVTDVLKSLPQVKWKEATEIVEDGVTRYEVEGTDRKDRDSNASIWGDGRSTIRTEIGLAEVPGVVSAALKKRLPKFRPESAVSFVENGKLVAYLFEGQDEEDGEIEASVSADGKAVKVDGEEVEDDDDH